MNQTPEFWKWAKATPEELMAQNDLLLDLAAGRINTARAIVKALAECASPDDRHEGECVLCGCYIPYDKPILPSHSGTCPWRMAVEFMKEEK